MHATAAARAGTTMPRAIAVAQVASPRTVRSGIHQETDHIRYRKSSSRKSVTRARRSTRPPGNSQTTHPSTTYVMISPCAMRHARPASPAWKLAHAGADKADPACSEVATPSGPPPRALSDEPVTPAGSAPPSRAARAALLSRPATRSPPDRPPAPRCPPARPDAPPPTPRTARRAPRPCPRRPARPW